LLALKHGGVAGEVINIGTGRRVKINELCQIFLKTADKPHIKPVHEDARVGDVRYSQADISKGRKLLGFEPKVSLEKGVEMLWRSMGGGKI